MAHESNTPGDNGFDGWWRVWGGLDVVVVFAVLTVPLVVSVIDARLYSPLALPGYTLLVSLTVLGERIVPQFGFRVYWVPYLVICYVLAIVASVVGRALFRHGQ